MKTTFLSSLLFISSIFITLGEARNFVVAEKQRKSVSLGVDRSVILQGKSGEYLHVVLLKTQSDDVAVKYNDTTNDVWTVKEFDLAVELCTLEWTHITAEGVEQGRTTLSHLVMKYEDGGGTTIGGSITAEIQGFSFNWNQNWTDEIMIYLKTGQKYLEVKRNILKVAEQK